MMVEWPGCRSHFCLAPSGDGWGTRLKLAIRLGCIPLVIQDGVVLPFEEVLPYQDFAIRLPQHMTYRLPQILDSLLTRPEHQARVRMSYPAYMWPLSAICTRVSELLML